MFAWKEVTCWINPWDWHQVSSQKGSFTCRGALGIWWSRSELSLQGAPFPCSLCGPAQDTLQGHPDSEPREGGHRCSCHGDSGGSEMPSLLAMDIVPFYAKCGYWVKTFLHFLCQCFFLYLLYFEKKKIEYLYITIVGFSTWPIYSEKVISLIKELSCYYRWNSVCRLLDSFRPSSIPAQHWLRLVSFFLTAATWDTKSSSLPFVLMRRLTFGVTSSFPKVTHAADSYAPAPSSSPWRQVLAPDWTQASPGPVHDVGRGDGTFPDSAPAAEGQPACTHSSLQRAALLRPPRDAFPPHSAWVLPAVCSS